MMYKQVADALKPPRVNYVRFPFGQPLGEVNNHEQHLMIVEDALCTLATAQEPGTIVQLPYRWRREDCAAIRRKRGNILPSDVV